MRFSLKVMAQSMNKHLLILTCTINSKMSRDMKRIDPVVRLEDYVQSIKKWVKLSKTLDFSILVVENSNSIEVLKEKLSNLDYKNISYFQVDEDTKSHLEGNSSGEFKILKDVLKYNLIPNDVDFVWKITGRIYVSNFKKIFPGGNPDFVVNRLYSPNHTIDTRIIGLSVKSFKEVISDNPTFTNLKQEKFINNNLYASMEDFITKNVLEAELSGYSVISMKEVPIFHGFAGTTNKRIDSKKSRAKKSIANLIRPIVIKLLAGSIP